MRMLFVLIPILFLTACTDPETATRAAEAMGLTDVKTTGYNMWACGDTYTYSTEFTAKNVLGKEVNGVVCSGYMSGASVRIY